MKTENEYNEILSMVTHDLKSPLSASMAALEMLYEDDLDDEDKLECINIARRATKSALKLAEDILVMAKYEAGKEHFEKNKITDLKTYFYEIQETFKYQMKIKNIDFKVDMPNILPEVFWDIDKIKYHVINNIISNALKFTDERGKISLSVSADTDFVIIKIKDNGIGIAKEKQNTIFQKYDTHKNQKVFKGTGLGLYNANCFVDMHGGSIEITNGIDDKGIGFKIILPINL